MRELQAVLFDMDGTLLDSERLWDISVADLAQWRGGVLSAQTRESMVGTSLVDAVGIIHAEIGSRADERESAEYLLSRTAELFRTDLIINPGARELLDEVHAAQLPTALVTSTSRRLTEIALGVLGRHYFDHVVCGDEVSRTKPAPEPYLTACKRLGVAASECVAIEDSIAGTTSAAVAGCAVLVVGGQGPQQQHARTHWRPSLVNVTVETLRSLVGADL